MISDNFCCTQQSCGNQEKTANSVSGYDFHGFAGRERRSAFQMCGLTQGELLPRVRRQRESEQGHGRNENTRYDEIEEVVESSSSDVNREGDVHVRLRTTIIGHAVLLPRNS